MKSKNLIVVDIQPEYEQYIKKSNFYFIDSFVDYVNKVGKTSTKITFLYNGKDTLDMISEDDYKNWLYDRGINDSVIKKAIFYDKGYAFFRYCMDEGIAEDDIASLVKIMYEKDVTDSRDLDDEFWQEYIDKNGSENIKTLLQNADDCLYIPDLMDFLKNYQNITICGGGINECLKEVEIALKALNKDYKIASDYTYEKGGGVYDQYTSRQIKKVYVSIRIKYEYEKVSNKLDYGKYQIKSYDEKTFQELKDHKLKGIIGVSTSKYNLSEWLVHRECLVVMPFDKFLELNDTEQVQYYDADYLTKNGLDVLHRLYDRKSRTDRDYYSVLENIFPKIYEEFYLEGMVKRGIEYTNMYVISDIFNKYNSSKFISYVSKQERISSPNDLANIVIDYVNSGQIKIDYPYNRSAENLTLESIIEPIKNGIVNSGKIYVDESEWLIRNKELIIPENSQLFFVLKGYENSRQSYEEIITKYDLQNSYKIGFINQNELNELQTSRIAIKRDLWKEQYENSRNETEKRILKTLKSIQNQIIENWTERLIQDFKESNFDEIYKDYDGNSYSDNILEVPSVIIYFDSLMLKFIDIYNSRIDYILKTKNKYSFADIFNDFWYYIDDLINKEGNEELEVKTQWHHIYKQDILQKLRYYSINVDIDELGQVVKSQVGSNLYRYFSKDEVRFKKGGKVRLSKTPAPKKERIYGSKVNKPKSSESKNKASSILLSPKVISSINTILEKHNSKSKKKIPLATAKAVVRRGMGAYSSTHRPTISGGKPNSRVAWGLARLNAFVYKIQKGYSKSGRYTQDDDLINELGYKVKKYDIGGIFQGTPHDFNVYSTEYAGTGEGNQVFGWGLYFTDQKDIANYYKNAGLKDEDTVKFNGKKLSEYNLPEDNKEQIYSIIDTIQREDKVVPTTELIIDYLILEYDEENYPEFKELVDLSKKTYNFIKDKDLSFVGNIYSVTLFKDKKPSEYDLLIWEEKPNENQIFKIKNQAKKEGIDLSKLPFDLEMYRDSNAIYTDLSYIISGVSHLYSRDSGKKCSEFLLRAGIDGIKYKAGTLSGFEDKEGYNYVIFNANDVTIEKKEKYESGGNIEFEYKLNEVYPNIFLLEMNDQYDLASCFVRCQAFYEWDNFRGKDFKIEDFHNSYAKTYPQLKPYQEEFYGFNLPSDVIRNCYQVNKERNNYDNFFLEVISKIKKDNYYLIGVVEGDNTTLNHELAHAFFWADKSYRDDMTKLVNEIPNKNELLKILNEERGYGENVLIDEAQAFLSTGLIVNISDWEDYRNPFIERFERKKYKLNNERYEIGGIFHGSPYYFDKFNTSKIGSGIGQQRDGWGIYLTDDKESAKNYGNYIYKTEIFKGKKLGEYTLIDLKKPVKKYLVSKIIEAYKDYKDFDVNKLKELIEFSYSGYLFYKTLSRILGGDKEASLFLLKNGIDGLKSSFKNSSDVVYRNDYVIFDENAISIESKEHLPKHYYSKGGRTFNDKELLAKYNRGESIGFTAIAHLKAKGLIKRADGKKRKSFKYKYESGGEITLTSEQVEQKLERKLHWWNDDIVSINGIEYKKVFLKNEYKKV